LIFSQLLLVLAVAALGLAQTSSPRHLIPSLDGRELFVAYCASCHGLDARGGGPVASALKTPVPDLTRLPLKHGKFPVEDLEKFILGEGPVKAAHGSADMPVWGPVFRHVEKDQDFGLVRVRRVVEYLKTLQRK
jgi:cytochrome c553